ncbi:HAD-IIB family hydrolase [Sinobaca sp. H24]|uniref:HAD-IIB family hydrolase n=1 Tax=Sinobaca sp. H24 TaxID=2923376 RepID=UPI00207AD927|nr:HAD-IIB family hydrolase [Sinobaca sp. H24]
MKTIAIDMDGTLLHEDGYVTKENASALKKLQEKGDKVVIATGRGMPDVQRLLNEVNVKNRTALFL